MGSNPAGRANLLNNLIATDEIIRFLSSNFSNGQVAQSVEQRTENPCVGGSIPPQATNRINLVQLFLFFIFATKNSLLYKN